MCGNLAASQPGESLLLLVADCNAGAGPKWTSAKTKRPANCNKVTPLAENSDPATRNPSLLFSGAELNKGGIARSDRHSLNVMGCNL